MKFEIDSISWNGKCAKQVRNSETVEWGGSVKWVGAEEYRKIS
jgi:hypothetical protein